MSPSQCPCLVVSGVSPYASPFIVPGSMDTTLILQEYLEKKYGKEAASRMAAALDTAGQTNGINFNSDRRVHNTIRSHRLVQLADQQDKGDQMIEQLFHGYFEKGMNIADVGVLLEIAQKVTE